LPINLSVQQSLLDLKDFFPTVTYPRVKGIFKGLGYSEAATTLLALLCTEPDVDEAQLDNETWFIANGERHLPQGAPTSPALTNILCRRLDARLYGLTTKLVFVYTRYADDLTFSATGEGTRNVNKLKSLVHQIVENEDFHVHPDKTRVMRKGSRKEVTGIIVNDKPAVDRPTLRKFRALLYQIEKDGLTGKRWGHSDDVLSSIQGYANFVSMVDPAKGKLLKEKVKAIVEKADATQTKRTRKTYPKKDSQFVRKSFGGEVTNPVVHPVATPATTVTPGEPTPTAQPPGVQGFVWKLLGKIGGKK
jgi:hypothetical protein